MFSMSTPAVDLRYPVGRFEWAPSPSKDEAAERREQAIRQIASLSGNLRSALAGFTDAQLDTPYRPEGWTVRQVIHHIADSHINAYTRFKLALTEDNPTIKPYDQDGWASLPDTQQTPVEVSLTMIDALHARWTVLLRSITADQWQRGFVHPEMNAVVPLDKAVAMYAWHSQHHLGHITALRKRNNW
jgi:hypothetical protein